MNLTHCKSSFGTALWNGLLLALPLWALIVWGCAELRPTQGLLPSCSLYAVADCAEIQYHRTITREQRLTVWRTIPNNERGITVDRALLAAKAAGWIPDSSTLQVYTITDAPVLADIGQHEVCIISVKDGMVQYLDPRWEQVQSMRVDRMDKLTKGFYWRIIE